ncbi:hypothetical protein [Halosimplex sp. J119]
MNALCPGCRAAEGEIEDRTHDPETGLRIEFRCPDCDHEWSVTL